MTAIQLRDHLVQALEERKGQKIEALNVADLTTITDHMVIVTGTSNRHVKSLVDEVIEAAKHYGEPPLGVEGRESNEWVLIDVGDVIVHVMQKDAREFYDLERLWSVAPVDNESRV